MTDTRRATWASVVVLVASIGLMVFHALAGSPGVPARMTGSIAFGAPFFTCGLIGLLGERRGYPVLVLAAGVALCPISLVSIVLFPVVFPASVMIAAGASGMNRLTITDGLAGALVLVSTWGTFAMLVFHIDPASWATEFGSASSSNIITMTESMITFAVLAATLATLSVLDRQRA